MSTDERLQTLSAQFTTILDAAPFGVGLFDLEVRHVRVNPELERMNGVPEAELLGRTPSEVNGTVGAEAETLYRSVMASGEPMRDVAMTGEVAARPGVLRHWNVSFFPVREAGGDVLGLCVIVDDVTERLELQRDVAESEQRWRTLAEDLQQSLQPATPPEVAGVDVATAYRPGSEVASVGGDFYDVLDLGSGCSLVAIGDVQGKGPVAASVTAAVRFAIRTAAIREQGPADVLRIVNEVLVRHGSDDTFCTVACVVLDRPEGRLRVRSASAGHPLPLVDRATGGVEPLGQPGPLLGALADVRVPEHEATLDPGDRVVLYTDGVTEAGRAGDGGGVDLFGEERLHDVVHSVPAGASAADVATAIEDAVTAFSTRRRDDLAVVVLVERGSAA